MVKYYQMCEDAKFEKQKRPGVTNYIGECIFLIATQLATRPNFNGVSTDCTKNQRRDTG